MATFSRIVFHFSITCAILGSLYGSYCLYKWDDDNFRQKLLDIRQEGYEYGINGIPEDKNPYVMRVNGLGAIRNEKERAAWSRGYIDAVIAKKNGK